MSDTDARGRSAAPTGEGSVPIPGATDVADAARAAADSRAMTVAARLGLTARGVVYILLGLLALAVARGGRAEVDQKGVLAWVVARPFGGALVLLVAVGLAGYALWRFSEAAFGAAGHGREAGPRLQSLARGLVYAFLSATAFSVLMGSRTSQAGQQSSASSRVLQLPGGPLVLGLVGAAIVVAAVVLARQGFQQTFMRYFDGAALSGPTRDMVRRIGTLGTLARAIVFALVGVLVVVAAWTQDPHKSTGIDGVVRTLKDQPFGDVLLLIVAVGLVLFGVYGLAEARWRRV